MRTVASLCIAISTLIGCASEVPVAVTFPDAMQQKIKSARQWDVIAQDTAQGIHQRLSADGKQMPSVNIVQKGLSSHFEKAFAQFLTTELVNIDVPVVDAKGQLTIEFDVQVIKHDQRGHQYYPGSLTALSAGVFALNRMGPITATLATTATGDVVANAFRFATNTKTEVMITTSAKNAERYIFRRTNVYYVEDPDDALYQAAQIKAPNKVWKVTQ